MNKHRFVAVERFLTALMEEYPDDIEFINYRLAQLRSDGYGMDGRECHETDDIAWRDEIVCLARIKAELISKYTKNSASGETDTDGLFLQEIPTDPAVGETSVSVPNDSPSCSASTEDTRKNVGNGTAKNGAGKDSAPTR